MGSSNVIWFEVLTPKQAMLFLAIGKKFQELGFSTIYTTRDHDYIHDIFAYNNVEPISIGKYGGKTLEEKLLASSKRVVDMAEHIIGLENRPLMNITFSSPDASRVAFGLGIPIIIMNDTTHSKPVARLTLSLAKYLITQRSIDPNDFISLGANPDTIHRYEGVDEVEYLLNSFKTIQENRLQKKEKYLVFRPEESFAAYMKDKDKKPYLELLEQAIESYNGRVFVLPRYKAQKEILLEHFEGKAEILDNGLFYIDMLSQAEVMITGGGTMAREAALVGIPAITYFWRHLEPQQFLEQQGFPSYSVQTVPDAKKLIKKICQEPSKFAIDTSSLITKLERPSDILFKILKKDDFFKKYFS
ncbi:MAG: DUF354 domain-containing protein [Asgard group archaeon]|nr:DUF354 domain-containing protein [Asgard group archaeon]